MEVRILKLIFSDIEVARRDIPKIRGFIASNYPEYDELHNHKGDKYIYRYPLIQYKDIDGKPAIVGINEGADIIASLEDRINSLNIGGSSVEIFEKNISYVSSIYEATDSMLSYSFCSPWMCLNEKNYRSFVIADSYNKAKLLKNILIGNILSMSQRFNYTVDKQLNTYINLTPCKINFKNNEMIGFKGEFIVNFYIPDYIGLGKSVSRGFGTVRRQGNKEYL